MKSKTFLLLMLVSLGILSALPTMVSATANFTCTVNTPATGATISSNAFLANITVTYGANINASWCTLTIQDTTNGTAARIIGNDSISDGAFAVANFTGLNLPGIMFDASTYIFGGSCGNGTAGTVNPEVNACTTTTGVKSGFSSPVPIITSHVTNAEIEPGFTISGTCRNCSSAKILLGGRQYAATVSGSGNQETFTYTFGGAEPPDGTYSDVRVYGLDQNADSITTTGISLIVAETGKSKGAIIGEALVKQATLDQQQIEQQRKDAAAKKMNTTTVVILVAVGLMGFYLYRKGKR